MFTKASTVIDKGGKSYIRTMIQWSCIAQVPGIGHLSYKLTSQEERHEYNWQNKIFHGSDPNAASLRMETGRIRYDLYET